MPASPVFADQSSLEAVAAASGRPRECSAPSAKKGRSKKPSVWQRARVPELVPYCDLLAKAHVLLESDPKAALELADKAEAEWPGHAGARIAKGRALLALGKPKEALEAIEQAAAIDKLSVEEPKAMKAQARALVLNGRIKDGAELYRTMVPRSSLLSERQRAQLLLEAALASMADSARPAGDAASAPSTKNLAEAIAYIGEARSVEAGSLGGDILIAAALIHDRAGDKEKASVALAEATRVGAKLSDSTLYVADPADAKAFEALALERTNPAEAQRAWTAYLEATKTEAFAAAARARLQGLKGNGGKAPATKPGNKKPKKGAQP